MCVCVSKVKNDDVFLKVMFQQSCVYISDPRQSGLVHRRSVLKLGVNIGLHLPSNNHSRQGVVKDMLPSGQGVVD